MDLVPFTIVIISFILTLLLVVLGVQVWYILKEIRTSLIKTNKMLDDVGQVTGKVSESVSGLAGIVSGLKAGLSVFSKLRKGGDHE